MRHFFFDARSIQHQLDAAREIEASQQRALTQIFEGLRSVNNCIETSRRLIRESREFMQQMTVEIERGRASP